MYRLLIVDDEPVIVEGLAAILGFYELPLKEVKLAYSAKEAFALFDEALFDIVLTDIRMPIMDGLQMIEKVKSKAPFCKFIVLTGYSDFEYARQAIKFGVSDYLLKPVDDESVIEAIKKVIEVKDRELENMLAVENARAQLHESINIMKEEFFRKLYEKTIGPDQDILKEKFKSLKIPLSVQKPIIAGIIFRIDEWSSTFESHDGMLIQFAILNMLNEMLGDWSNLESFQIETDLTAIVIQSKEESIPENIQETLQRRLVEAQDTILRVLETVVSFGITAQPFTWRQWHDEIHKVVVIMRMHLGKGAMIVSQRQEQSFNSAEMAELIRNITEAINLKDIAAFEKHFDKAAINMKNTLQDSTNNISGIFMAVSGYLLNMALSYNLYSLLTPENMERLTNLYKHKNLDELKVFLVNVLKQIISMMDSYCKNPSEVLVNQVKSYISDHLDEDLSLDALAKRVYTNPSYLSRIFSQHTQEQLSNYIARIKMEYAKQLLKDEGLKIHEISLKAGYENSNYFAKVFRKFIGVSPQEFRLLNKKML